MIDFGLVDVVDAEAIGAPGERTFRLRARAGSTRAALWMEKEQLAALGRAISQLLADRARRRDEPLPEPPAMDAFGLEPDVELRVVRLGIDYLEDEDGRVRILVDDQEAAGTGQHPRVPHGGWAARRRARSWRRSARWSRRDGPLCPLCGRALEGDGQHFCPGSNGHSGDEEIPAEGEDEDFPSND